MEIITRNEKSLYIGIDVHKDTYSLCSFDFHKNELSDEMTIKATRKKFYLLVVMKQAQLDMVFAADYNRLVMAA